MILTKTQQDFLRRYELALAKIFEVRIDELKEIVLDAEEKERGTIIDSIKENKFWLGVLKGLNEKKEEEFTGI